MFRGDAAHHGVYQAPPIAGAPRLKWRFHTGGHVISSPAVADGIVYIGSTDRFLYALDESDGREKWRFKTGARVASSPAVANGLVFFGSYDGNFYAVDAATGTEKWRFATAGERRFAAPHIHGTLPKTEIMPDPFDFYLSSPAIADGTVYFGSGDGNVYALGVATGAPKWKFATGNVVHASPAIADGLLYVGSWDHYFYALDAASGRVAWKFETGTDNDIHNQEGIQSSAVVSDGIVYFGCRDSNLYALDAKTGKKLWAYNNKGSWVIGSPAVADGTVYWSTADGGLFHASDARTGNDRFTVDFRHWPMFSSPVIVGNEVYFGSHTGRLYAVDRSKGTILWAFATDASKKNGPAFTSADGTPNYGAVTDENFYDALVVAVNRLFGNGMILSSPAVAKDGSVYFGSMDGDVYALARRG